MVRCAAGVCACLRSCSPWPGPARCEATSGNRFTSVSSRSTTRRTTVSTVRRTWCCPTGTGPGTILRIPLIISPHGRGVSAEENVDRWGDLPSINSFAVVNPEGQGRRFARFSWGYAGQIDDLARMPRILRAAIPWLRIEPRRIYAFGTSMGGQETLLLVARHPKLLAGAAAFDPVTNMASRYRDFSRLRCNHGCLLRWGDPIGFGLRALAREEIGGTPKSVPRAYARRSPITYARAIARSGVPLQLWWSKRDHVVGSQDQSAALARKLRRLNPAAPLHTFVGSWPHSADMRPYFMLIPALKGFDLVPTRAPSTVRSTQSPPVHPLLPWHHAVLDGNGKLLPWYRPNAGLGYDRVLRLGWNFIERGVPRDPRTRSKVYLNYAVFDGQTLRGIYWQHNPAFLNAAFVDSLVSWYPYSADRRAIGVVREMLDYQLAHGTSPAGWAWPQVPFSTACAGERRYGRCLAGLPRRFYGGVETDKVGATRPRVPAVLRADRRTAVSFALRSQPGTRSQDTFARATRRIHRGRFASTQERAPFSTVRNSEGSSSGPVRLLDELDRGGRGQHELVQARPRCRLVVDVEVPVEPRQRGVESLERLLRGRPLQPAQRQPGDPTLTAQYLLDPPCARVGRSAWDEHAAALLRWVQQTFGRGPFLGAWGSTSNGHRASPAAARASGSAARRHAGRRRTRCSMHARETNVRGSSPSVH